MFTAIETHLLPTLIDQFLLRAVLLSPTSAQTPIPMLSLGHLVCVALVDFRVAFVADDLEVTYFVAHLILRSTDLIQSSAGPERATSTLHYWLVRHANLHMFSERNGRS